MKLKKTKVAWRKVCFALAFMCVTSSLLAATTVIRGTVTDRSGKPIRGAIVTATAGDKSVTRYSQDDGRFQLTVSPGHYDVTVNAFRFQRRRESVDTTTKSSRADFKLNNEIDLYRLTSAEIETLLPDNQETRLIRRTCMACHGMQTVIKYRGLDAAGWAAFIPNMARKGQYAPPTFDPARMKVITEALAKYFGPDSQYFAPNAAAPAPEKIDYSTISEPALSATITEYKLPTPDALPNGVVVDKKDRPWWNEINTTNAVGMFDPVTEQFHSVKLDLANSMNGTVDKAGNIWIPLDPGPVTKTYTVNRKFTERKGMEVGLAKINPDTFDITYYKSSSPDWHSFGPRTLAVDPQGNIWGASHYPAIFDIKKETFHVFQPPVSKEFPEGTLGTWTDYPGLPKASTESDFNSYNSVSIDSKGMVYLSKYYEGTIVRLDPATGETKGFRAPGMVSAHGVVVDGDDNVWVCDTFGDKLDKLDAKTGKITQYQIPTADSQPFGATIDKRSGLVLFGEDSGNRIVTFDPKTEKFVEYPLPTPESFARFVATDSKGKIWYGAGGVYAGKIGVIDPGHSTPK